MPTVQLPDGKDLVFDKKVNGFEISEKMQTTAQQRSYRTLLATTDMGIEMPARHASGTLAE